MPFKALKQDFTISHTYMRNQMKLSGLELLYLTLTLLGLFLPWYFNILFFLQSPTPQ